jgi:hypothetical protein
MPTNGPPRTNRLAVFSHTHCRTNEERMQKKCANCAILLDIPCVTLACPGHHNESVGNICAYCAANEREDVLFLRKLFPSLFSTLEDFEPDLENA